MIISFIFCLFTTEVLEFDQIIPTKTVTANHWRSFCSFLEETIKTGGVGKHINAVVESVSKAELFITGYYCG